MASYAQELQQDTSVYHPRDPESSPLYKLLADHFPRFVLDYDDKYSRGHGFLRSVVSEVVGAYLKCGDLKEGFARVRCPECHHEFLLTFSCRGRWFFPSCHAKKVVQFAELLRENMLYPVPHRQYVFSVPIILRKYFLYNRKLLSKLCKVAADSLLIFLRQVTGLPEGILAAAMAIQTFGDYARWHPHIHAIVADGLFKETGVFYVMPRTSITPLAQIFRAKVFALLIKEGLIDDKLIAMLMKWRHTSGFSVDNSVRISLDDPQGLTALAQYIIRSPFSLSKLTYNEESGMVVYKSKMTHGHNKKNFAVMTAADFIASITQHIPDKNFQLARYYGWHPNHMRRDRKKASLPVAPEEEVTDLEVIDASSYKPRRIPPPDWRECIKKIWEVDPLECPHCQVEMKIISFITDRQVVRKILKHLQLWHEGPARSPPARAGPEILTHKWQHDMVHTELYDDGWPGYEEPHHLRLRPEIGCRVKFMPTQKC